MIRERIRRRNAASGTIEFVQNTFGNSHKNTLTNETLQTKVIVLDKRRRS